MVSSILWYQGSRVTMSIDGVEEQAKRARGLVVLAFAYTFVPTVACLQRGRARKRPIRSTKTHLNSRGRNAQSR